MPEPKLDGYFQNEAVSYDALLLVSYGGPEQLADVLPFLKNVTGGRIPQKRLEIVAERYKLFNGRSPINDHNRALITALKSELDAHDLNLPVYWGNRNWHPLLPDTIRQMRDDGIQRALALFTSPYSSYTSCRQYREAIEAAREEVGPGSPVVDRIRMYFNHPGFIEPMIELTRGALAQIPAERRAAASLVFTAHSLPLSMACHSAYTDQLVEASRLVAGGVGHNHWDLVYQSRSGPPHQPWLEPDIIHYLRELDTEDVVLVPVGFISDHMEIIYDLDIEAKQAAEERSINLIRVPTVGTHPQFVSMIRELILERMTQDPDRRFLGDLGPVHDVCGAHCCLNAG